MDVYRTCDPETPLEPDDPRRVDLRDVRGGGDFGRAISRRIAICADDSFHQHLLTGHRGCGKTTELKQIQGRLDDDGYLCVYFDVEEILDVQDLEYLDVLVAIAQVVHQTLNERDLTLSNALVTRLQDWFASIEYVNEKYKGNETALQTELGADAKKVPILRFLSLITSSIRSGGEQRIKLRKQIRRRLNTFFDRMNDLLTEARDQVREAGFQDLVVIVDGLEKMPYRKEEEAAHSNHSVFFVQHAEALKKPCCHIIYTVPISLLLNQNLADAFPDVEVLPMVTPEDRGTEKLHEVISRRVDVETLFDNPDDVDRIVTLSGGALRDLLRLIRFACDETDDVIASSHVDRAEQKLVREYDYQVREADLPPLQHVNEHDELPGDDASARLLHQRLVLEYFDVHGNRRAAVHPALLRVDRVHTVLSSDPE